MCIYPIYSSEAQFAHYLETNVNLCEFIAMNIPLYTIHYTLL